MLKHILPLSMHAVLISIPGQARKKKDRDELRSREELSAERFAIEFSSDGVFKLEWHYVRAGVLVRVKIELEDEEGPEPLYGFHLLYSKDVSGDMEKIVAWILANRSSYKPAGVLAVA